MKTIFLFASIIVASGLLLTNIYTSIVDATSWGSDIPGSIEIAREYFKHVNPGNFFRLFAPVAQILALLVLILFWKTSSSIRLFLGIAFVIYVLADVLTFAYFYPRNDILFKTAQLTDIETIRRVWSEWNTMNWVRSLIIVIGITFSSLGLHKYYTLKQSS
ncbi:MAG: DUF1772 domain-containing protein [Saprospiraceae bacterium]